MMGDNGDNMYAKRYHNPRLQSSMGVSVFHRMAVTYTHFISFHFVFCSGVSGTQ